MVAACGRRYPVAAAPTRNVRTRVRSWRGQPDRTLSIPSSVQAAATHPGGPLLVLAGAGTGKTTPPWPRASRGSSTRARHPSAYCWSRWRPRRAAREMLGRARSYLGARPAAATRARWSAAPSTPSRIACAAPRRRPRPAQRLRVLDAPATPPTCSTCVRKRPGVRARPGGASRARRRCSTSTRARSTPSAPCASCWPRPSVVRQRHATTSRASSHYGARKRGLAGDRPRRPAALLARAGAGRGRRRPDERRRSTTCWSTSTRT